MTVRLKTSVKRGKPLGLILAYPHRLVEQGMHLMMLTGFYATHCSLCVGLMENINNNYNCSELLHRKEQLLQQDAAHKDYRTEDFCHEIHGLQ